MYDDAIFWRVVVVFAVLLGLWLLRGYVVKHQNTLRTMLGKHGFAAHTHIQLCETRAISGIGRAVLLEVDGQKILVIGSPRGVTATPLPHSDRGAQP